MKMNKILACVALVGALTVGGSMTGYASEYYGFTEVNGDWMYVDIDGTYLKNEWAISGAWWFYLDSNGYMLLDAVTPDGYTVDETGTWVVNGVAQSATEEEWDEWLWRPVKKTKQVIYDKQNGSFADKKTAVLNYLKALDYNTESLSIIEGVGISYSAWGMAGDDNNIYYMLKYNSQNALNELSHYMSQGNNADKMLKAMNDYEISINSIYEIEDAN